MIVVFVRRSNDIDHLAPVIWATAAIRPVLVLSMNPYLDLSADYRLRFLAGLPRVTLGSVYRAAPASRVHAWLGRAITARGLLGRVARAWFVERRWGWCRRRWFNARWAAQVCRGVGARLLVFDWVKPEQHVTRELLAAARELRIPTIALPHGVTITTGDLRTRAAHDAGALPDYDRAFPFDVFVAPHHDHADYFARGGMPPARLRVLGSARFADAWIAKGREIAPDARTTLGPDDGRLKVVFFDKDSFSLDHAAAAATVRTIASLPFVRAVVKPQTRNDATRLGAIPGVELATDIPSVSLVDWADVVVGTVSSVLLEPLCQGKVLIYPAHHCTIGTRLQAHGACVEVRDDAALADVLRREHAVRGSVRADGARVAACLDEIVYARDPERDVLQRYTRLLSSLADQTHAG